MEDLQMKQIVSQVAKAIKPAVDEIEKSIPTCKDHYDKYMVLISGLVNGSPNKFAIKAVITLALNEAGANMAGVRAALQFV